MGKVLIICILGIILCFSIGETQNVDKLCRQVYTDCQACSVFQSECLNRPPSQSQKPQTPPRPSKPQEQPTTLAPTTVVTQAQPQHPNCFENDRGCNTSDECCNRNCKVESIPLNGNVYTIKVCRSPTI